MDIADDAGPFGIPVPLGPVADLERLVAQDEHARDEVREQILHREADRERKGPEQGRKGSEHDAKPRDRRGDPQRDEQGNRRHDAPGKPSDFLTEPPRAKCSLRESNQRDPGDRIDDEERHEEDRDRDGEANQRRAVLIDDLIYQLLGVGRDR